MSGSLAVHPPDGGSYEPSLERSLEPSSRRAVERFVVRRTKLEPEPIAAAAPGCEGCTAWFPYFDAAPRSGESYKSTTSATYYFCRYFLGELSAGGLEFGLLPCADVLHFVQTFSPGPFDFAFECELAVE